jgi:hypothetical protein
MEVYQVILIENAKRFAEKQQQKFSWQYRFVHL